MNKRRVVLAVALAGAAWLALFGDKTPAGGIAEPVLRQPARALPGTGTPRPGAELAGAIHDQVILALQPRETLIGRAPDEKQASQLFAGHSWTPPPPPPPKPPPPPPPSAPSLPFTYLGKKVEGDVWEVYLSRGDQTHIVTTQSVIDGTYRVESISPPKLTLVYLPLNEKQTLAIGGID